MTAVEKGALLARRLTETDYELEGIGTLRIRGLSRAEVLQMQKLKDMNLIEARMLSLALVAPALTEDEVSQWLANSTPGEIEPLTLAVANLSGMGADAPKQAYQQFRG